MRRVPDLPDTDNPERPISVGQADHVPAQPASAQMSTATTAEDRCWNPRDIVEEWGLQSFPASDPPANW